MKDYDPIAARRITQRLHAENVLKSAYQVSVRDAYEMAFPVENEIQPSWEMAFWIFRKMMDDLDKQGRLPWGSGPFWEG